MRRELRVDPTTCSGHGLCAELLPELITLDEWGYPIIAPGPVPAALDKHVRRAVTDCPVLALKLLPAEGRRSPASEETHSRPRISR